jgi:DNA-binding NarL/FixJ family response regulator
VIRVLIAEDHAVVRAGLNELLENRADIEVAGEAANGSEAVQRAIELRPDVVLMDLSMPEMDGIEATRRIAAAVPDANVVVLTSFSDRERILQALDAGAVGYLLKDLAPDELHRGIQAAARGESPLAPKAAHAVIAARAEARPAVELSSRESEVLGLVAEGLPNKLIARRLEISEKTVKAHLTRVFAAIGVTDRTQAALWAQRNFTNGERGAGGQ